MNRSVSYDHVAKNMARRMGIDEDDLFTFVAPYDAHSTLHSTGTKNEVLESARKAGYENPRVMRLRELFITEEEE